MENALPNFMNLAGCGELFDELDFLSCIFVDVPNISCVYIYGTGPRH